MDADATATFLIAAALIPFTRSAVSIGLAQDDAAITALTPASAVFVTNHANVLDVAIGGCRPINRERRSSCGSCEERADAHRERNRYLVHDVLQTRWKL
jgi:hypothetical protein